MSHQADPLKPKRKVMAEPGSSERSPVAVPIDSHSVIHEGEDQPSSHKAHVGVSVSSSSKEKWHLMLEEILNSEIRECIDAITVNLEAYCSAVKVFKAVKAHPEERRKADRRISDGPKINSEM